MFKMWTQQLTYWQTKTINHVSTQSVRQNTKMWTQYLTYKQAKKTNHVFMQSSNADDVLTYTSHD